MPPRLPFFANLLRRWGRFRVPLPPAVRDRISAVVRSRQLRNSLTVVQIVVVAHLFLDKVGSIGFTHGASMLPSFSITGDGIVISKLHVYGRGCRIGDVISFSSPVRGPDVLVCKRIIGMPGDFVVKDPTDGTDDMLQVPRGHVWVTGDNLPESMDSRRYGPVPLGLVKGKVVAKFYPLRSFGWIKTPLEPEGLQAA